MFIYTVPDGTTCHEGFRPGRLANDLRKAVPTPRRTLKQRAVDVEKNQTPFHSTNLVKQNLVKQNNLRTAIPEWWRLVLSPLTVWTVSATTCFVLCCTTCFGA